VPDRLDRVTIALPHANITITWDERDALMRRMQLLQERNLIRNSFQAAVGASRTVQFTDCQRLALQQLLATWSADGMPGELNDLLNELAKELTDESAYAD